MEFDFDTGVDRRNSASLKWEKYRGRDVIPLWVADMDFKAPPAVLALLKERVEHGVFGYTVPPAELTEVVRARLSAEYGWEVAEEWLVWLPGLVTGLNVACRTAGDEGDGILTTTPVYPPFLSAPALARRELQAVPLASDGARWAIDFDRLEEAVTSRSRLFLLCNPHNPVGRVYTAEELSRLADLCCRHDLVLCSDEIHAGLVLDEDKRHLPIATLDPAVSDRTITLLAPSKTYNLPGLGCSFAVIPNASLRRRFRGVMAGIVPHVNLFGFTAALAAYRDADEWHRALLSYLRGNRDLVERAVQGMPGSATTHVEATYLAWLDVRGTGLAEPVRFFEEGGAGLSDGAEFGLPGFVRLNFGCPRALLAVGLRRMRAALDRL